jgi:hypothetical protein
MRYELYNGRQVQVIDIDDVNGERVLEFVDSEMESVGAILAIHNRADEWSSAQVSISPGVDSVSVEFMQWALSMAQQIMSKS